MNGFVTCMQSSTGRLARIVVGAALIGAGNWLVGGVVGAILAVVGAIPLLAGILGICLLAPLFGYTLRGEPKVHARI